MDIEQVEYKGLKFNLRVGSPTDMLVFNEITRHDGYGVASRKLSGTVLDIGCNIAVFSCLAASRGAKKVIAFEPEQSNYDVAMSNIKLNGFEDVIQLHKVGLSDRVGADKLLSAHGNSFVIPEARGVYGVDGEEVDIELDILDHYLSADEPISFCKMDAEGSELKILKCSELFNHVVREFAMEFHGLNSSWYEMFVDLAGYFNVTVEAHEAPSHVYGGMMFGRSKNASS